MTKIKKYSLKQLTQVVPVLSENEQNEFIGGGDYIFVDSKGYIMGREYYGAGPDILKTCSDSKLESTLSLYLQVKASVTSAMQNSGIGTGAGSGSATGSGSNTQSNLDSYIESLLTNNGSDISSFTMPENSNMDSYTTHDPTGKSVQGLRITGGNLDTFKFLSNHTSVEWGASYNGDGSGRDENNNCGNISSNHYDRELIPDLQSGYNSFIHNHEENPDPSPENDVPLKDNWLNDPNLNYKKVSLFFEKTQKIIEY